MREIKYMAWHKAEKKIYHVAMLYPDAHMVMLQIGDTIFSASLDEIELMQYTGLKDRSGKEVYEGNIVKFTNHLNRQELLRQCKWDTKYPSFVFCHIDEQSNEDIGGWRFLHYLEETKGTMEIIGNIYEKPKVEGES